MNVLSRLDIALAAATLACLPLCRAQADLLVASLGNDRVLRYDQITGAFLGEFVSAGSGGLDGPDGLAFGPDGNLYVSSNINSSVLRYDGITGAFLDAFVPSSSGGLSRASNLVFGRDYNLYVLSPANDRILRYNGSTGAFIDVFAVGIDLPFALVFGPTGNLYVTSEFGNSVLRYDGMSGTFAVPPGSGGLEAPLGLAFGSDGNLYVATGNTAASTANSILRYDGTTGAFLDVFVPAGSGGLGTPNDILFGPDGNLYVGSNYPHPSDQSDKNSRVVRYDGITGAFLDTFVVPASGGLDGASTLIFTSQPVIPEPATFILFGIGLLGAAVYGRRRWRNESI